MKYIDYGTMQSDAQRRVLEMQRRARNAIYFSDKNEYCPETPAEPDEPCSDCSDDCFAEQHEYSRPTEKHCAAVTSCDCRKNSANDIIQRITNDPEEALLLAILVLLISEKADMLLILALVYLLI